MAASLCVGNETSQAHAGVVSAEQAQREDMAIVTIQAAHRGQQARAAHVAARKQADVNASISQGGEGTASLSWAELTSLPAGLDPA